MKKNLWITGAGLTLIVGFFLPFISLGPGAEATGWDIVRNGEGLGLARIAVFLVPFLGAALITAGLAGAKSARLSLVTGLAILCYPAYEIASVFFAITGVGLWLVLAAGLVLTVAGLAQHRPNS